MRLAAFRLSALLLSSLLPAVARAQTPLAAGSGHYTVYQGDKAVGASDYAIQLTPNGFTVTSHGKLNLTKFSYSFSNSQHLDGNLNLVSDQLSGTVNGNAVTFAVDADSTGRQFQINISANGKQTQNTVDRHQHLVLLPDLDPAAYVLLTRMAMENPPTSWILIPKENGILVPSTIIRGSSVRGQLNGSQMDVQHATISVNAENSVSVDVYYNSNGQVLEADLPQQNFFVVHDGFKLIDRPKPTAPSAPPPNSPQQGGSAPPQYPAPRGGTPQLMQQ
ncbi:MAG: hypothetical protein WAK33_23485 [Silvibacterium sp.]